MYRSEARERMELGRNTRDSVWLWARECVLRGTNSDGNPLRAFIREVICVRCSREKKNHYFYTLEISVLIHFLH